MLPNEPCFLFNIDMLLKNNTVDPAALKFINNILPYNCFFFTDECDISHHSCYKKLINNNFLCKYKNILSPNFILIQYIKKIYGNFSASSISTSKDMNDFIELKIPINDVNPNFIFINTTKLSAHDLAFLRNTNSIISFSYKLCPLGNMKCNLCKNKCILEYIINTFNDRILIPERNILNTSSNLFSKLSISSRNLILVVDKLKPDYDLAYKYGCKIMLILNDDFTLDDYVNSEYESDIVLKNFEHLLRFLKK
ncbi:hypothetical protein [Clostridium massiliodielmoense]|uniref:hypothetical protein n=1 Tax=Clostridium massiliodielmoense TaxID=1776385 RepID=UPI0001668817|nr:hypothetical protein [Clostridium massiliodielmoense]EDS78141.1 conserved hypothetical protein [Clostridium botulinum C str. Eklund]NEZ49845.1 hypothetical protein [Clostridium botulinum]